MTSVLNTSVTDGTHNQMTNFPIITPRRNTTNRRMIDGMVLSAGGDDPFELLWSAVLGLLALVAVTAWLVVFAEADEVEAVDDDADAAAVEALSAGAAGSDRGAGAAAVAAAAVLGAADSAGRAAGAAGAADTAAEAAAAAAGAVAALTSFSFCTNRHVSLFFMIEGPDPSFFFPDNSTADHCKCTANEPVK